MPSTAGVDWRHPEEESVELQHPALSTFKGQIEISFMWVCVYMNGGRGLEHYVNFTLVNSWKFLKFCRVLSSRRQNQMSARIRRINRSHSRCFSNDPNGLNACTEDSPGLFFLLAARLPTCLRFFFSEVWTWVSSRLESAWLITHNQMYLYDLNSRSRFQEWAPAALMGAGFQ